jgi:hypothetical protein
VSGINYCIGLTGAKYPGRFNNCPDGHWEGQNKTGLIPESLFEAQLNERLSTEFKEFKKKGNIELFPNQANGFVRVQFIGRELKYSIVNSAGETIKSGELLNDNKIIYLYEMEPGCYFIVFQKDKAIEVHKFIHLGKN